MSPFLESLLNNIQVIFFLIDTEALLLSILSRAPPPVQTELLQEDLLFSLGALISILYIAHCSTCYNAHSSNNMIIIFMAANIHGE